MIKPIDKAVLTYLQNCKKIFFYEESIRAGSVGECFGSMLIENGLNAEFRHIAVDNEFVKQASVSSQMKTYHMDTQSVIEEVKNAKEQ